MRPTYLSKFRSILDSSVPGVCAFRQELRMPKDLDRALEDIVEAARRELTQP